MELQQYKKNAVTSHIVVLHHIYKISVSKLIAAMKNDDVNHLSICAGNSTVAGEFPAQRPLTRSFDISFDLRLSKRSS